MKTIFFISFLFLAAPALAQEPVSPAPLSELEQLKIERANLISEVAKLTDTVTGLQIEIGQLLAEVRSSRAQAMQQQVDASVVVVKNEIEASRPGYQWDPATGQFTPKPPK